MDITNHERIINNLFTEAYQDSSVSSKDLAKATPLKFSNKALEVPFPKYEKYYNEKDWIKRKITALPKAIFSGFFESIYHLVKSALLGIKGDSVSSKVAFYSGLRDLEESAGWIKTLVNDKKGSYTVDKALFMKSCYKQQENVDNLRKNKFYDKQVELIVNQLNEQIDSRMDPRNQTIHNVNVFFKTTIKYFGHTKEDSDILNIKNVKKIVENDLTSAVEMNDSPTISVEISAYELDEENSHQKEKIIPLAKVDYSISPELIMEDLYSDERFK